MAKHSQTEPEPKPSDDLGRTPQVPETLPMPTGSGVFDSRSDWLVERQGEIGKQVDPDAAESRRREREIKEKS